MTDEKGQFPTQASGEGHPRATSDGAGVDVTHGRTESESQGGAYPNPHTGKEDAGKSEGFHGGQSKTAYHGSGQLGEEAVEDAPSDNSPTKKD